MSNSKLVSYTKISPNKTKSRKYPITRISIHCVVGQCTVESLGNVFAPTSRKASSNYGVGKDGRIGMYVEECDRSWCTSSSDNDNRAVTIETASDTTHPYAVTDAAYAGLLDLCTDICERNGKKKLLWFADKKKTLAYKPADDEMVLTVHRWFANKSCPGEYLYSRHGEIAAEVTRRLSAAEKDSGATNTGKEENADSGAADGVLYRVQTGAYSKKANADAQLAKVKAAGFDTYMVFVDGLYKIQVGAFKVYAYAEDMCEDLKAAGFSAFITTKSGNAVTDDSGYTLKEFIKDVQTACGAAVDGVAGEETLSKTVTLSAKVNARHAAVKAVQQRLLELGYVEVGAADGIAGMKFTSAVAHFQLDNDCTVDGVITAKNKTWRKLLGMK